jgi:hypothetical protein
MKQISILCLGILLGASSMLFSSNFIPANHPFIRYHGRWDLSDSLHAKHSWPGVSITAEFTGTSIGVRFADSMNYYNVYLDGMFIKVLHGGKKGDAEYILAEHLSGTHHTIRLSKRNIVFDAVFSFSGFLLDDGAELLPPSKVPERRIEFIGDSFTAAESNEAAVQQLAWEERFPVTNIDKGFAAFIADHFKADFHTTCRSGSGMVCDWRGDTTVNIPNIFNRTLMESPQPTWEYAQWIPHVTVICLGLNDFSGLKNKEGFVTEEKSNYFRAGYHAFIQKIRTVYPGVKILAVAAYPEWIRNNVALVVDEEKTRENLDIFYGTFDDYPGGYVANGHPTVETHRKIADQIIRTMEQLNLFSERDVK